MERGPEPKPRPPICSRKLPPRGLRCPLTDRAWDLLQQFHDGAGLLGSNKPVGGVAEQNGRIENADGLNDLAERKLLHDGITGNGLFTCGRGSARFWKRVHPT